MKSTGIIRRIDELGRIVIPKEIRQSLKINNGENIEIFIEEENIILSKYSNINNIKEICEKLIQTLNKFIKNIIIVCDTQNIIATNKPSFFNKGIQINHFIKNKEGIINSNAFIENNNNVYNYISYNITMNGDLKGILLFLKEDIIKTEEKLLLNSAATFLSKYLEE